MSSTRDGVHFAARKCAAGAFAGSKLLEGGTQIFDREVGPAFVDEIELGERALPQQKIRDALLAAGANEEIDVGGAAARLSQHAGERFLGKLGRFVEAARGAEDRVAGGVIDREAQDGVACRARWRLRNR